MVSVGSYGQQGLMCYIDDYDAVTVIFQIRAVESGYLWIQMQVFSRIILLITYSSFLVGFISL